MGIRTIRMDDDAERMLTRITRATGMSISATFKEGLKALQADLKKTKNRTPYAVFEKLDLGPGGYAAGPSSRTKQAVKEAVLRKLGR